jgi:hypothetical protein
VFPARYGRNAAGVPRSALTATPDAPAALDFYNWAVPVEPGTFYSNYFRPALVAVGLPASAPATDETEAVRASGSTISAIRRTAGLCALPGGLPW